MKMKLSLRISLFISIGLLLLITTNCKKNEDSSISGLPEVITSNLTFISTTTAQCGGVITSMGGHTVTQSGICYSKKPIPSLSDSFTINESNSTNTFSSTISGLTKGTSYYVCAYAINSQGTSYGKILSFTTLTIEVTLANITSVLINTAVSGGNVINDGDNTVIKTGICWSTKANPTISDSKTDNGSTIGTYTSKMTDLTAATKYYVKAYVTTSKDTYYSTSKEFTTFKETVKDADSITYKTAQFGDQIWMTDNLNTTKYNDGTPITLITDNTIWSNAITPGYCLYNNTERICGLLYNYYAASTNKICPTGWHVPNYDEWYAFKSNFSQYKTKFDVDLGGKRSIDGTFSKFGELTYWWASTQSYCFYNSNDSSIPGYFTDSPKSGNSVRCIKD